MLSVHSSSGKIRFHSSSPLKKSLAPLSEGQQIQTIWIGEMGIMHCKGKKPSARTSQQQQWLVYSNIRYLVCLWTLDEQVFCRAKQHTTNTTVHFFTGVSSHIQNWLVNTPSGQGTWKLKLAKWERRLRWCDISSTDQRTEELTFQIFHSSYRSQHPPACLVLAVCQHTQGLSKQLLNRLWSWLSPAFSFCRGKRKESLQQKFQKQLRLFCCVKMFVLLFK